MRRLIKLIRSGGTRRCTFKAGAFKARYAICRESYGTCAVGDTLQLVLQSYRARVVLCLA